MKRMTGVLVGLAIAGLAAVPRAEAGRIVVVHDEWTLSNAGFSSTSDPGPFALNVAGWFTGGGPGNFHAYSTNFGLTGSSLASVMTGAGHSWAANTSITFDLPTLLAYDGIFLAGNPVDNTVLINYVNAGGNVYLAGGTGWGGAAAEAAQWQAFLNAFGFGYGTTYNGVGGHLAISSLHPIFAGVDHLYQDNGNSIFDLAPGDPQSQILVSSGGHGLYAVYDPVPEPGTLLLLGSGLGALWTRRRRR